MLGLKVTVTTPFAPNVLTEAIMKLGHTEGGQSRIAVLNVPGLAMGIELIEYKDISRKPQRPHFTTRVPPTCRSGCAISMRVFPKIEKFPGVKVLTAGGKPVTLKTPNGVLHAVFVQDPDGFVVEMLDVANPPAGRAVGHRARRRLVRGHGRDSEQTVKFYNELLGFDLKLGAAFNDNQQMASTAGAPGASFRQSTAHDPGHRAVHADRVQELERKELSGRTQDPARRCCSSSCGRDGADGEAQGGGCARSSPPAARRCRCRRGSRSRSSRPDNMLLDSWSARRVEGGVGVSAQPLSDTTGAAASAAPPFKRRTQLDWRLVATTPTFRPSSVALDASFRAAGRSC